MLIRSALGAADKRRIQAMLFANNGGDLRQQLLDGAPFLAELTHSLIPTRGSLTPSFTRATTATGQKWDEAGYLDFTALAGEAVFMGARRERNHFLATEAMDGVSWTKSGATVTASAELDPEGETRAFRVQLNGGGLTYVGQALAFTIGSATLPTFYVKSNTAGDQTFRIIADGGIFNSADFTATQEWQAFKLPVSATTQANDLYGIREGSGLAAADILVALPRCSNITGETDQTTIRPYVSVGVESAPAYHGSMVDGVKCYDTDRSGNPISTSGSYPLVGYVPWEARTNSLLQANAFTTTWSTLNTPTLTQNAVGPNGAAGYAWTVTDNDAASFEGISQTGVAWGAGFDGCVSFLVGKKVSSPAYPIIQFYYNVAALASHRLIINEVDGTVVAGGTTTPTRYGIESYNVNFWLVWIAGTQGGATVNARVDVFPAGSLDGSTVSAAAVGSTVFCNGRFESGAAAPSPYIPTTTIAVARNADVEAVTTSGAILAVGGTISLTYIPYHSPVGTIALWGTYVDASNYTAILHDATNLIFRKRIAGVNYDATIANAFTSGTTYKMAASWGAGGSTIHLNGVAGTPHANTTAAQIAATMQFGADGNSLQQPGAAVIKNYIWQRQLSASEMQAITA